MFLRKKNKNQQRYNNYYQGIPLVIPQAPTPAPQPIRPQITRPQIPTIPNIPRRPPAPINIPRTPNQIQSDQSLQQRLNQYRGIANPAPQPPNLTPRPRPPVPKKPKHLRNKP
ncbi:hypothetical protein F8M41_022320 [Gigaspora margarita]|uniref:Uncharacterized protein n=1 Tax=Gigaspora margarita TaxID=4874 RepID=A0A8H4AF75_GIGMA|nr:hypothetical protein F8M41_014239 [Gigaspora margarita]KAF0488294.1 hypothetical protein F8M41_022320 [Gigaspora margarita]